MHVMTRKPGRVALHLLDYPAWRVTVNGKSVSVQHPQGTQQMIIPVPAGESELRVDFMRTTDRTIGGWISMATLISSICVLLWMRRTPRIAQP